VVAASKVTEMTTLSLQTKRHVVKGPAQNLLSAAEAAAVPQREQPTHAPNQAKVPVGRGGVHAARAKPRPGEPFAPAEYGWHVFDSVESTWDLTDSEKRVLVRLMRLAGPRTWARTTSGWLAQALGKSRRRVFAALASLESKGYLRREPHGPSGGVYRFLWRVEYEHFQALTPETVPHSSQEAGNCDDSGTNLCRFWHQSVPESSHRSKHDRTLETRYRARAVKSEPEPVPTDGFDATETFRRIWGRHPRKTGRYLAEQALSEALAEAPDPSELAARIEEVHGAWCASEDWTKQNGRFAPQLHRWLIERRWLDGEPQAPADEEPVIPYRPYWETEEAERNA
jgi:predicted transcriptional regulator